MVGTMIAAGVFALEAGTIAYAATAFAVNFAVSMIVTRVFGQDQQGPQDSGTREQVPPSNTNAIPIVYGEAYLGGTFVDAILSTDQQCMYYVMAISCISPNGQFTFDTTDMYYGDRKITFDGTDKAKVISLTDEAGNVDDKIFGRLYIGLYTSSQSGVITNVNWYAPSYVLAESFAGKSIPPALVWPSSGRQMNGLAFAIIRLEYDQEAGTTSLQPITFKVKHSLFGTGVAKPGDVWADYISNMQYGGAIASTSVDTDSAIALNNYSDELITFETYSGPTNTQARYRINGVLDAGQTVLSNLDKIMTCCDSWMAYNAASGKWSIVINKAETATYSFDDDNIIGEVRVSATDITQSINQIEAKFPNKNSRDQPDFVNLATPEALRYPNEPENKYSVNYDLVNDSVQAQYLANRILEQAREDLIVSFNTTYYGIQVDAGAVVSVTNSAYGWTNKLFRVVKVNEASLPDGSLGARLEMSEYSAAVYDDFNIKQYSPVPNSDIPSAYYFSALSAPIVAANNPTSPIPNFNVSISIPAIGRVTYSELYYTTVSSPIASDWKLLSSATTVDGSPVTPGSNYIFENQVLSTGASTSKTYYFCYIVGNSIARSPRSPISSAFNWSPSGTVGPTGPTGASVTGPTGPTGTSGLNSATVLLYNKNTSTTAPALFTGTFTYTFSTGVLSGGTLNGWTQTPPSIAAGEYLFLSTATATSTTATDTITADEFSTPHVISGTGIDGAKTAIVSIYQKNTSAITPPSNPSGTFTYTFATAVLSGGTLNGWSQSAPTLTFGEYLWVKQATAYSTAATDAILATEFSGAVVNGAAGPTGPTGTSGASGNKVATAYLYQWSPTIPSNPSGQSTYTWSPPENSAYTGGAGWQTTIPSNPGTPLLKLWVASKAITDIATATTTTVSWASGFSIADAGQNGANGTQAANPEVYQWAATIPTISGTSTYTWSSGTFTPVPSGWSASPGTATSGYTLWTARVSLVDSATATTSAINWTTASILASGYAGGDGLSSRLCFARVPNNPAPVSGTIVTTSNSSYPSSAQSTSTWGFAATWGASDPNPSSTDSLYQSDGIYDPSTNQTSWGTPYISSLKVGTLSAITVNTGALTVQDTLTISSTGSIEGGQTDYSVGTGFFLGYSGGAYKFSIGSFKSGTASTTTDAITLNAHGYTPNTQITFTNVGSITGISVGKVYYIVGVTTNTFQVAASISGAAINLTGTSSTVSFTTQGFYWNGSALNITGNLIGGTIKLGAGNTTGGYAFEVSDSGVVYADNLFGGVGFFINSYTNSEALIAVTNTGKNYPGLIGYASATNSTAGAHGVRGQNFYNGAAGLVGGANNYDFYADGSGTNYGPFTGNHDILVPVGQTLNEGDLVVDVQCVARKGWSNAVFEVAASTSANQSGCRGVFVGNLTPLSKVQPSVFIESQEVVDGKIVTTMTAQYEAIKDQYMFGSMSALGEGQIQVCGQNGDISVDTLIVTSDMPGVGMAQSDDVIRSMTVAKARESVTFSSPDEIKVVACIYLGG